MRNKTKRLLTIRKLIESELISSQEELLFRLKEMNVEATQSTLSRDLKFMKVAKIPHKEKGYIYVIPESIQNEQLIRESSTDNVLKGEYLIKDSHPDVYQILGIEANSTITNKEILADKIMIEGQINYSVMYLSEDESKETSINSVYLSEKFADYIDINSEEHKVI